MKSKAGRSGRGTATTPWIGRIVAICFVAICFVAIWITSGFYYLMDEL